MAFATIQTNAQAERMALLIEELGEALRVIGKIQRHGWDSHDPTGKEEGLNSVLLTVELGHVLAAIALMMEAEDISIHLVEDHHRMKLGKLTKWLHNEQNILLCDSLVKRADEIRFAEPPGRERVDE